MIEFLLALAVAIGLLYWAFYTFAFLFVELLAEQPETWTGGFAVGFRTLPKAMALGLLFVMVFGIVEPALAAGRWLERRLHHA